MCSFFRFSTCFACSLIFFCKLCLGVWFFFLSIQLKAELNSRFDVFAYEMR